VFSGLYVLATLPAWLYTGQQQLSLLFMVYAAKHLYALALSSKF
jgi:hypothetical protein